MSETRHVPPPGWGQKLAAEGLGTFVLVFLGVGSVVVLNAAVHETAATLVELTAIGLTFGIAVMVMVYAVGRISGGHFNPAVSLGAALGGRVAWTEALLYMVVQVVGAIVGAAALFLVANGYPGWQHRHGMGANSFGTQGSGIDWWAAMVLEAILTMIFVLVILAVTDVRNEHPALAPLAIGFTLAAIHFVAIPATGTSVNPARSIGPALFDGTDALEQVWLFIVAPLLGGAIGGLLYPLVFGHGDEPVRGSGLRFGVRPPDALQQQWTQQAWASGGAGWQQQGQQQQYYAQPGQPAPQQAPPSSPQQAPGSWEQPPPQGWPNQPAPDDPDDGRTQIRPQH